MSQVTQLNITIRKIMIRQICASLFVLFLLTGCIETRPGAIGDPSEILVFADREIVAPRWSGRVATRYGHGVRAGHPGGIRGCRRCLRRA